jgi:FHA domain
MSEHGVLPGLWPIHGDGVLARQGDLVLLIHPAGGAFTDRLLDLLAAAARAGESGLRFTELVSAEFDADASAADLTAGHGPAVVAFGPAGGGTAVAVYGTGWAEVTTTHGAQRLTTGEPYGRLRCVLPSTLIKVRAGVQPVAGDVETDPYLRLADGVVRAVGFLYAPAEVEAAAAGPSEQDVLAPPAPAYSAGPNPSPAAVETPASAPEAVPGPPEPVAEPRPDLEVPEPEYYATRVESAVPPPPVSQPPVSQPPVSQPPVSQPPAGPVPPLPPDPYVAQPPPPVPEPYAARLAGAAPPAPPAPNLYAAQPPPGPYADQAMPPGPGPAAAPQDFISISLLAGEAGGEVPQRDPLPLGAEAPEAKDLGLVEMPAAMVEGVYCKNGHFNDPEARYCAVCGISMGQLTKVRQEGKRPPLGVLILSDGSVCQLDADYVIGREPTLDSAVAEGKARPLRLMGASGVVSRIHARVELDGWQVFISDLNSANGTQILLPGERNPATLQPGVRTPMVAGTQIRLGGEYGLQYDSHRHR